MAVRVALKLRIVTEETGSFICEISADRTWKCIHLKRAIEDETGIVAREIRLHWDLLSTDDVPVVGVLRPTSTEFMPSARKKKKELKLDEEKLEVLPEGDEVKLTLTRRPREQAEWLEKVKEFGLQLRLAPPSMKDDYEVVFEAVRRNWKSFEFASPKLRGNAEIAFEAIKRDSGAATWVMESLWRSRDFVMRAVQEDYKLLKHAHLPVQDDKEVVMIAVRKDYRALSETSDRLLRDREVLILAVLQSQDALRFV